MANDTEPRKDDEDQEINGHELEMQFSPEEIGFVNVMHVLMSTLDLQESLAMGIAVSDGQNREVLDKVAHEMIDSLKKKMESMPNEPTQFEVMYTASHIFTDVLRGFAETTKGVMYAGKTKETLRKLQQIQKGSQAIGLQTGPNQPGSA